MRRHATVSATAGQAADGVRSLADRFGIEPGMVVMEMGYDDDVDEDLRDALTDRCGELVDEDTDEVVDAVLLWYRDGDGDLFELLVDALGPLADNGVVWLLTPKAGRDGHVEPSEITESAPTAGLQQTSTVNAGKDWSGARLVLRRGRQGQEVAAVALAPGRSAPPGAAGWPSPTRPRSWHADRGWRRGARLRAEGPEQPGGPALGLPGHARPCCWSSTRSPSPAPARASCARCGTTSTSTSTTTSRC